MSTFATIALLIGPMTLSAGGTQAASPAPPVAFITSDRVAEPQGEPNEGRVIPLSDIWALDMPGTKPMTTAFGTHPDGRSVDVSPEGTLLREILRAINTSEWPLRDAPAGFAVRGTGMAALREAHAVLVHGQPPRTQFRPGEQISLVFFSKNMGRYVNLVRVVQYESTVEVSYELIAHETDEVTSHLALIPMSAHTAGDLRIEIRPMIDWTDPVIPPPSLEHIAQRVCHSFVVSIQDEPRCVIPLADIWALDMPGTKPMNRAKAGDGTGYVAPEGQFVQEILDAINSVERRQAPESGFAVRGEGLAALRQAHSVIVGREAPPTRFSAGEKISLVFHSKQFGSYIHIDRVRLHGGVVEITYRVVPHHDRYTTSHFALVPLALPERDGVWVEISASGIADAPPSSLPLLPRIAAKSFSIPIAR